VTGAFSGTLTFAASTPVGVIALRGLTNQRGEFTFTPEPISPLTSSNIPLILGHFAEGAGWQTQLVLVNPTDQAITGHVQFFGEGTVDVAATPLSLSVNGVVDVVFGFTIPARSAARLDTAGLGSTTQVGSILVTPDNGSSSPNAFAVFSFTKNGLTVSQTSVTAQPAAFLQRAFVELIGVPGSAGTIESSIAITNASASAVTVNFELTTPGGLNTGLTAFLTVPAFGHTSRFLHEIFPGLVQPFTGVLRIISGTSSPIAVTGFRTRYNERGDFLITTTPVSNELLPGFAGEVLFPQIVEMDGYTTQFDLFSGSQALSPIGTLLFFTQTGQALSLSLQ
jgi:hypothetical protein